MDQIQLKVSSILPSIINPGIGHKNEIVQWAVCSDLTVQSCHSATNVVQDVRRTEADRGRRLRKDVASVDLYAQQMCPGSICCDSQSHTEVNGKAPFMHSHLQSLNSHSMRNGCVALSVAENLVWILICNLYPVGNHFTDEVWATTLTCNHFSWFLIVVSGHRDTTRTSPLSLSLRLSSPSTSLFYLAPFSFLSCTKNPTKVLSCALITSPIGCLVELLADSPVVLDRRELGKRKDRNLLPLKGLSGPGPDNEMWGYETSALLCLSSGHFWQSRGRQPGHSLGPDLIKRNTSERCDRLIRMVGTCWRRPNVDSEILR